MGFFDNGSLYSRIYTIKLPLRLVSILRGEDDNMGPIRGQRKVSETRKIDMITKRMADLNDKINVEKLNLQRLKDGTYPEYLQRIKKMEEEYKDRLALNQQWREHQIQLTENLYKEEIKEIVNDVLEKIENVVENNGIRTIEQRKPKKVVSTPCDKEVKGKCVINYTLDEKEIEEDLKAISTKKIPIFEEAKLVSCALSSPFDNSPQEQPAIRIENRRLLFDKQWFCRGQAVNVYGKGLAEFPAIISSIGADTISFKSITTKMNVLISIIQLLRGDVTIKRRML